MFRAFFPIVFVLTVTLASTTAQEVFRSHAFGGPSTPGLVVTDGVLADFDRDGVLDVLVTGIPGSGPVLRAFRGDGTGRFVEQPAWTPTRITDVAMVVADVDLDGDPDVVMTSSARVLLNDGAGRLVERVGAFGPVTGIGGIREAALADLDGDGDPDLVVPQQGRSNRLFVNDGSGRFREESNRLVPDNMTTDTVAIGDVDGDGDQDIVFAGRPSSRPGQSPRGLVKLHLNDGQGFFADVSATNVPNIDVNASALMVEDLDGDGAPDIFVGEVLGGGKLLINDGTGRFVDASARLPQSGFALAFANDVAAADIDLDGDPDVVIGRASGPELWIQDESGSFSILDAGRLPPFLGGTQRALVGDVDRDGDPDILSPGTNVLTGANNVLWLDQHRHVDASAAPRIGGDWVLEAGHRPLAAPRLGVAFPLVATQRATIPLAPFGVLGLDPNGMVALDPVALSPSLGHTAWTIPVPGDPGLIDVPIAVQLLILEPLGTAKLTNVWTATIGAAD